MQLLNLWAYAVMISFTIFQIGAQVFGFDRAGKTKEFIEQESSRVYVERIEPILSLFYWLLFGMGLARIPLILVSIRKPNLCKYFYFY